MRRFSPSLAAPYFIRRIVPFLISLLIVTSSCTSDDNEPENSGITGEWLLVEMLLDPGDGSGRYIPVDSNKRITISPDGTYSSNSDMCSLTIEVTMPTNGTYSVVDTGYIIDCSDPFPGNIRMNLDEGHLIISFPCIEPCLQKFRRIN